MDYSLDLYTYRVSCMVSGADEMDGECRYREVVLKWVVEEWGACSKTCGKGYQSRVVQCVQPLHNGTNRPIHAKYCSGERPDTRQACDQSVCPAQWRTGAWSQLELPHTVPADGAVGVEVEGHQAFWTCGNKPFILVLTTVPPHTDSLGVSTKTKAGLVTEDDPAAILSHSMTVWYDTTAVFGDGDVVLRTVVCSVSCGEGIQQRQVVCRASNNSSVAKCEGEKPERVSICKLPPCPGNPSFPIPTMDLLDNYTTDGEGLADAPLHKISIPADGAVGVEVEGHQVFWARDNNPFLSVLTTVPPHTGSLGVSTKTKAGLVTEDDPLPF
ncbi:hypothetical protein NFI96_009307 [Prochilodus magdalenae]|nr:hypothetical protein NFI96_009307 [Prochilodus magdalenae]